MYHYMNLTPELKNVCVRVGMCHSVCVEIRDHFEIVLFSTTSMPWIELIVRLGCILLLKHFYLLLTP